MGKWIFLIFLVWAVWQDLRSRTVGQGFLAAAGALAQPFHCFPGAVYLAAVISSGRDLSSDTGTDHGWRDRGGDGWFFYCDRFFSGANRKFLCFFYRGSFFAVCTALHIWPHPFHRRCRRPAEKASVPPFLLPVGLWLVLS